MVRTLSRKLSSMLTHSPAATPASAPAATPQPKRSASPLSGWLPKWRAASPPAPELDPPADVTRDLCKALADNDNYTKLAKGQSVWAQIGDVWRAATMLRDQTQDKKSKQVYVCSVKCLKRKVTLPLYSVRPRAVGEEGLIVRDPPDMPADIIATLPGLPADELPAALHANNMTQQLGKGDKVWLQVERWQRGKITSADKCSSMYTVTTLSSEVLTVGRQDIRPVHPPSEQLAASDAPAAADVPSSPVASETLKEVLACTMTSAAIAAQHDATFAESLQIDDRSRELLEGEDSLVLRRTWVKGCIAEVHTDSAVHRYSVQLDGDAAVAGSDNVERYKLRPVHSAPETQTPPAAPAAEPEAAAAGKLRKRRFPWQMLSRPRGDAARTPSSPAAEVGNSADSGDLDCTLLRNDVHSELKPGQVCWYVSNGAHSVVKVVEMYRFKSRDPLQQRYLVQSGSESKLLERRNLLPRLTTPASVSVDGKLVATLPRGTALQDVRGDDVKQRALRAHDITSSLEANAEVFVQLHMFQTGTVTSVRSGDASGAGVQPVYEVKVDADGRTEYAPRDDLVPHLSVQSAEASDSLEQPEASTPIQTITAASALEAAESAASDAALAQSLRRQDTQTAFEEQSKVVMNVRQWVRGRVVNVNVQLNIGQGVEVECGGQRHKVKRTSVRPLVPDMLEQRPVLAQASDEAPAEEQNGEEEALAATMFPPAHVQLARELTPPAEGSASQHDSAAPEAGVQQERGDAAQSHPEAGEPEPQAAAQPAGQEHEQVPEAQAPLEPATAQAWTANQFAAQVYVHNGLTMVGPAREARWHALSATQWTDSSVLHLSTQGRVEIESVPEDVCCVVVVELWSRPWKPRAQAAASAPTQQWQCIGWTALAPFTAFGPAGATLSSALTLHPLMLGPGNAPSEVPMLSCKERVAAAFLKAQLLTYPSVTMSEIVRLLDTSGGYGPIHIAAELCSGQQPRTPMGQTVAAQVTHAADQVSQSFCCRLAGSTRTVDPQQPRCLQ
jgi:hypothetical protein